MSPGGPKKFQSSPARPLLRTIVALVCSFLSLPVRVDIKKLTVAEVEVSCGPNVTVLIGRLAQEQGYPLRSTIRKGRMAYCLSEQNMDITRYLLARKPCASLTHLYHDPAVVSTSTQIPVDSTEFIDGEGRKFRVEHGTFTTQDRDLLWEKLAKQMAALRNLRHSILLQRKQS